MPVFGRSDKRAFPVDGMVKATALKLERGDVFEEQQGHQRGVGGCRKGNPPEFGGSSAQVVPRMHCEKQLYVVGHALPSSRF